MTQQLMVAVLAGGEGRRMGGVKALRPFRGTTLLAHAVAQARRWSDRVVVVVRDAAQAGAATDAPLIFDEPGIEGPLAGLAAALRHAQAAGADLLLTTPCDTPNLPLDLPQRLAAALTDDAAVVAPEADGRLEPALALWRPAASRALGAYLGAGRRSLQGFAAAAGLARAVFTADEAAAFANANTVEALEALQRR